MTMKLHETLSTKFGSENAETLANYIEDKINEKVLNMETKLLTKLDNLLTKDDGVALKKDIAELKADLYKWMAVFFVAALGVLVAAMAFFKD